MKENFFCMSTTQDFRKKLTSRINRIAGQLRGVEKMIDNCSKCDEVLNQIASIKSALNGVAKVLLESHMKNCVVGDIKAGFGDEVTDELLELLSDLMEKSKKERVDKNQKDEERRDEKKTKEVILREIEAEIDEIRKIIERDNCSTEMLKDIGDIKGKLESLACEILKKHIKNCLVREVKLGNEEHTIDGILYTVNKMIK